MTNIHEEISTNFILTKSLVDKYLLYVYNDAKRFNGKLLNTLNKKYGTSYTNIQAWEIYYNLTAPSCKNTNCCTNVMPAFFGFIQFKESPFECFRDYCCNSCAQTDKSIIDKGKSTKFKNHGDANFNNREKSKLACLERYGVETVSKSDIVKKKKIDTCLKNNGVMHPMQSSLIRKKLKETCLKKYDVENPMQDGNIAEKCMIKSKQFKIFILPSGKEIKFQGYEDQLIKILLNKHKEEEILFSRKDMPKIFYNTSDGKTHRYYPDMYVPCTNTIYEVKSEYTLNKELGINLRKFDVVKEMGYNFELHVF